MSILWERIGERKKSAPKVREIPTEPVFIKRRSMRIATPPPPRLPYVVERVIDGESLMTASGERIRLARVQAPPVETAQGVAAKRWLVGYCGPGVTITLVRSRNDELGRCIAEVFVMGKNVSDLMLKHSPVTRMKKPALIGNRFGK